MYYIYIIRSLKNNRYYIGSCKNVQARLEQHNRGESMSTKPYRPWLFVYSENFDTLSEARKREFQIKSWKKSSKIEKLFSPRRSKVEQPPFKRSTMDRYHPGGQVGI